ncbi:transglycosylase SLT domain-containing protein [Ferrovibrio xuzhouensis]|uniref:Transglycosylase SLT domain-containing protein n=1 Tax=Ferrovibrio xuzhouensis TaxID=1576914 RepID=A0ABV7VIN0_9PROT
MAPLPPFSASMNRDDVYRVGGHQVSYELLSTLKQASSSTGVDFAYLVAQAGQESGFRPDAQASGSSARGLFQFIDSTWLQMVRDHGAKYGLTTEAQQIGTSPDGKPSVADPAMRRAILSLRDNPRIASAMAAEYARTNQQALSRDLGIQPGQTDLYLGHFLGTSGASKFLGALQDNPAQNAAALLPEAAAANRGVFYDADGRARSVGEIYAAFQRKLQNNMAGLDNLQTVVAGTTPVRNSTVASHLDEQRRMIDHAVKMMAYEALRDGMMRTSRLMRDDNERDGDKTWG